LKDYHFHGPESRDHFDVLRPGGSAVDSGSAGTTAGTAEQVLTAAGICSAAADSPEPPISDRGAHITIPPENRFLLDWVAFTFKNITDPGDVLEIISIPFDLFIDSPVGFSGYRKSLRFGNISIYYNGRDDMGCHVEMSGQGCRQFEALFIDNPWQELVGTILSATGKFTRLDLAIDNVDGALSLELFYEVIQDHQQIRTLFGEWRRIQSGGFRADDGIKGQTIYLGSTKSHVMFRIYDKAKESGIEGAWIRFEIQLRDKRADQAAKHFATHGNVGILTTGIINNYFAVIINDDSNISRCTLQPWWSAWLQTTEKISLSTEKVVKLVSETMDFIKRQYAPSFAMIKKHLGGVAPFNKFVMDLLDDGNVRMSAKHEKMLAASAAFVPGGERHDC